MRSLLGVLRQDDQTTFGPQPGPERLDELADRVRSAGLAVTLERDAELADLPQAVGMSLFRLVQEALTNVLKHAGPQRSEEHTSELQSRGHLVCRLLLEKKK